MNAVSFLTFLVGLTLSTSATAQRFVSLDRASGALYSPTVPLGVAFLSVHRTGNNMTHLATVELPKRGFRVLGMATRFVGNEAAVDFDEIALDVRAGVRFLRSLLGVSKVILLGSSGGGQTVAYYQATASLADKADGIVFLDAHLGIATINLRGLNPLQPGLDPFDKSNGYNPDGDSTYSRDFVDRYSKAQAVRMSNLVAKAIDMEASAAGPADDDAFTVYHAAARLADLSTSVQKSTLQQRKLIKNDGSVRTQIISTVRVSDPGLKQDDDTFDKGALHLTLNSFLGANAIRATHALYGIDWCSDHASTICSVRRISVPTLVVVAQGHYFIRDGELIFINSASGNKDFYAIEGMAHTLGPCLPCSRVTGVSYSNATKNVFDLVVSWVVKR